MQHVLQDQNREAATEVASTVAAHPDDHFSEAARLVRALQIGELQRRQGNRFHAHRRRGELQESKLVRLLHDDFIPVDLVIDMQRAHLAVNVVSRCIELPAGVLIHRQSERITIINEHQLNRP